MTPSTIIVSAKAHGRPGSGRNMVMRGHVEGRIKSGDGGYTGSRGSFWIPAFAVTVAYLSPTRL